MSVPRTLTATLSVQTPGGLVFGGATKIDGMNLSFELEGQLAVGDVVEWRMELPGLDETAMGVMRVTYVRRESGVVARWTALILSLSPADADIFEVWRRGVEAGTRAFTVSKFPVGDAWLAATTMVGSSEAERKQAVAVEEVRRRKRLERAKSLVKNAKIWPDPQDIAGGQAVASGMFRTSLGGGSGASGLHPPALSSGVARPRMEMAAALRANLGAGGGGAPFGGAPAASGTGSVSPAAPADPAVVPPPEQIVPPGVDIVEPELMLDQGMASVRFTDVRSFRLAQKPALLGGLLLLAAPNAAPAGSQLQFLFTLPNGVTLLTTGRVIGSNSTHTEFALELSTVQRKTIEQA